MSQPASNPTASKDVSMVESFQGFVAEISAGGFVMIRRLANQLLATSLIPAISVEICEPTRLATKTSARASASVFASWMTDETI